MFQEHPEYAAQRPYWETYRDLYLGGDDFRRNAGSYLARRQKEPQAVYNERLERVFYENYAGSIVDWYAATLFRRAPRIVAEGPDERARMFFAELSDDCDRRGTDLTEFLREQITNAMVYGASYALVDFPREANGGFANRAEEDASGASRGYLQSFTPLDLIDWSKDERGQFDWVLLRTRRRVKERLEDGEWRWETRWTYYDRERFRVYRAMEGDREAALVDEGSHGLARLQRVPLFALTVSPGLWLMKKVASVQLEHFNKSNALGWALTMGLFAMPVIYSERDFKQMIGESYYIQLGPEDKFGWTEPAGNVYELAAKNLERLQREIYRICYLLSQGGGTAAESLQSAASKQRDFTVTQEILRSLGDRVKELAWTVLKAIGEARRDDVALSVTGLDEFDLGDFQSELADGKALLDLAGYAPTLQKQVKTRLALKYLSDAGAELKARIAQEFSEAEG
jgi:hypothetical protein